MISVKTCPLSGYHAGPLRRRRGTGPAEKRTVFALFFTADNLCAVTACRFMIIGETGAPCVKAGIFPP